MADSYSLSFDWPHTNANSVIVTGTFDNWTSSVHLHKSESGFTASVAVPWDTKILYKFIVDNNWVTHSSQPTETDASGFVNNVVYTPAKPVPAVASPEETEKEAEEKPEEKTEAPVEVVPAVPVPIQPVPDANVDTLPDPKPVDAKAEPSTHTPAPIEAVPSAPEPTPVPAESTEPVQAPSTPPRKESELPAQETPAAPVTPIKTNGTSPGHGHARTSTGTSTPPSSSAPSTPKTQRTFPSAEIGGGGESGSPSSSKYGSLGRAKRQSFFGKIREKFKGSPGKEKKKRLGSEEPRMPSPTPSPRK